jgi:hypothetical protein
MVLAFRPVSVPFNLIRILNATDDIYELLTAAPARKPFARKEPLEDGGNMTDLNSHHPPSGTSSIRLLRLERKPRLAEKDRSSTTIDDRSLTPICLGCSSDSTFAGSFLLAASTLLTGLKTIGFVFHASQNPGPRNMEFVVVDNDTPLVYPVIESVVVIK